ncbi:Ribosome biogenesis [Mycena sanguinolenta]|uniref:Ribosome biogenesis n=1 Tax=Mycena sanguinolenta TaxID=230812 RepID=A0A8H6YE44_9AGAR|nr:Ribosome biogenesis [Mycena sanguinolenta]
MASESTLGKRKERDEDSHGSTLFVSNLPYSATSVDLQTLFSDIAPVRSAFVVTEHGTGISKGVGYVSFTLKEDAQSAFETITKDGITLVGRSLRVQWADSKPKEKGERAKTESKPRPPPRVHAPHDPLAIRTIIVSGLPAAVDSKVLWKKFRKYPGAEKVDWPIKNDEGEDDPATAHVLFTSPNDAQNAVGKLHAHVFKGSLLSVTLKKRLDTLAKPVATVGKTAAKAVATPSHASRLIVRNIPFTATEQDLRAVFLPYGPVYSIHIPTADPKGKKPETEEPAPARTKGYAFVWMLSKKDAERAIEGCNGLTVRAGLAEGMVSDKQKKKKQRRVEMKMKIKEAGVAQEENEDDEEVDDKRAVERVIAVDWALSKDKWKEEKAKMGLGDGDIEMDDASTSGSGSSSDSDSNSDDNSGSDSDESDSNIGVHDGEDSDDGSSGEEDDEEDSRTPVKPQLPPPEEGTTLFVRNVPFSATEDELRTLFRAFGPLRYARITIDMSTGRSRGTGFACFWNKDDADKVVEQSDLLRLETTGTEAPKKNPFTLPSILTPDPSSTLARSLVLHGRTLDVVRAVTRDVAGKLKEDGERKREKADKRNMYLLREGGKSFICTPAFLYSNRISKRRTASYNARRTLLKSNPALFISKTRLSIRQIPIFVTERLLKRLAIHAVRAFQDDVKSGARADLSPDELAEVPDDEDKEDSEPKKKMSKKTLLGRRTGVKQAKLVRQSERVDPVTGKGRSKGYGFVEMNKHADALRVLRWANNNSDVGPLFEAWWKDELEDLVKAEKAKPDGDRDDSRLKRLKDELEGGSVKKGKGTLIVEFSIENITTIQRRNNVQKERKQRDSEPQASPTKKPEKVSPTKKVEERATKKARLSTSQNGSTDGKEKTSGHSIGSLIGRKRKERKAKHK